MTAEQELAQLEAERNAEIRNLNYLYSRTRRDVRKALSPDVYVKKHIGLIMGAAAMAGMIAAPGAAGSPARPAAQSAGRSARAPKVGGPVGRILRGVIPARIREHIPGMSRADVAQEEAAAPPPKPRSIFQTLLSELLPLLIGRINWTQLIHQAIAAYQQTRQGDGMAGGEQHAEHEPQGYRAGDPEPAAGGMPHRAPDMQPGNAGSMPG